MPSKKSKKSKKYNLEKFLEGEFSITGGDDEGHFEIYENSTGRSFTLKFDEIQSLLVKLVYQYNDEDAKKYIDEWIKGSIEI